eukprot:CAMPEP_0167762728 /NCGR_PEP_ID=MMETSP0110_2-20121227/12945_1 /TAXON_ID=629695 /ORGANISM="Gymnochlora sp., Strain CCMP2014" /LENGTH=381 /DNA_ID=CAMNT_0007649667 /DNA_START=8 /DNA_END=1153 /DNA_ORIENTATION=-
MMQAWPRAGKRVPQSLSVFCQQRNKFHSTGAARDWDVEKVKLGGRSSTSGITATVFGCSGYLGGRVVNNLGQVGSRVVCPYRGDGMGIRHLKMMGDLGMIVPTKFDIRDQESVEKAVSKSNVVINCIGNPWETRNFTYRQTYVDTNEAIAKACAKAGVERVINISAVNASLDSESPWLQANAEADEVLHDIFPGATTIKVTRMFGRMDRFVNQYAVLAQKYPFTPLIDGGEQLLQPVCVDDVADAVANAVLKPESIGKTYYVGGPETLVFKEFIEELQTQVYCSNSNAMPVPTKIARLFGYIQGQIRTFLYVFATISEDEIIQLQYDNVVPNNVLTLEDLDVTNPTKLMGRTLESLAAIHRGERGPPVQMPGRRTWDDVTN